MSRRAIPGQQDLFGDHTPLQLPKGAKVKPPWRWIEVVGRIWDPYAGICACTYPVPKEDADAITAAPDLRAAAAAWLEPRCHDFREIVDFRVDIEEHVSDWLLPDSQDHFDACFDEEPWEADEETSVTAEP